MIVFVTCPKSKEVRRLHKMQSDITDLECLIVRCKNFLECCKTVLLLQLHCEHD